VRPAAANSGWTYRDRPGAAAAGQLISAWYAAHHGHSSVAVWQARLAAGEIERNGQRLMADDLLAPGDRLAWHRPPWIEPAVPDTWAVIRDDGDLHVIAKPSGLPVLPAGGFLEHTVLRLLERRHAADPAGLPRPVHRLGRFTSGLLVAARQPASRAWLSRLLRERTAAVAAAAPACLKVYRALLQPGRLPLAPGEGLDLTTPIGRRPHPRLGWIWAAADPADPAPLAARSRLTLLERWPQADLVEVVIASGRPHQIRIHCAAAGAPLLGDPLYGPGGLAGPRALPGDGGYQLHAHRLVLERPDGATVEFTAPPEQWMGAPPSGRQHPQVSTAVDRQRS
jgi:23S rRNA pseudouridine1911/1915/1917 synthase